MRTANRHFAKSTKEPLEPKNEDRAKWGDSAICSFAKAANLSGDLAHDPQTVLCDLLADLMHWCDSRVSHSKLQCEVGFDSALRRARLHYGKERLHGKP